MFKALVGMSFNINMSYMFMKYSFITDYPDCTLCECSDSKLDGVVALRYQNKVPQTPSD